MTSPHDTAVALFVEKMAMAFADVGFPRMAARVLFTVMSADEPLSAAEIGQRLGVSPAAVSGAVRYLTQFSLLTREPVPGSRRDRYRSPDDTWYTASVVKTAILQSFAGLADEGVAALGVDTAAGQRMAQMRDFFAYMQRRMEEVVAEWHTLQGENDAG